MLDPEPSAGVDGYGVLVATGVAVVTLGVTAGVDAVVGVGVAS